MVRNLYHPSPPPRGFNVSRKSQKMEGKKIYTLASTFVLAENSICLGASRRARDGARGSGRQTCLQKLVPPADRNCRSWFKANNEAWTANKLNCRRLCGIFSAFVGLSSPRSIEGGGTEKRVCKEKERERGRYGVRGQSWTNLNHGILGVVSLLTIDRGTSLERKKKKGKKWTEKWIVFEK